jgi:hypothetical protein
MKTKFVGLDVRFADVMNVADDLQIFPTVAAVDHPIAAPVVARFGSAFIYFLPFVVQKFIPVSMYLPAKTVKVKFILFATKPGQRNKMTKFAIF